MLLKVHYLFFFYKSRLISDSDWAETFTFPADSVTPEYPADMQWLLQPDWASRAGQKWFVGLYWSADCVFCSLALSDWTSCFLCFVCRRGTRPFITSVRGKVIVWFLCCWKETPTPTSKITYVQKYITTGSFLQPDDTSSVWIFFFYRTEKRRWTSPPDWSSRRSSMCWRRHTDRQTDRRTDRQAEDISVTLVTQSHFLIKSEKMCPVSKSNLH